ERTPAGGPPRAQIDVTLRGFAPNEQVALHWETDGPTLATALTHGDGAARIRFAIPDAAAGIGSLVAIGQSSGDRAAATLRVDPAPSAEPDATPPAPERPTVGTNQTTGPGSFAVQAALTGSGGGATTSGHAITADDRFAALPVCVTTSCPWLDPGVNHPLWGVRVECGAACFVRVTDPASGRCVVAPALDVGPWFSDDDWWDAAPHRRINRLDGAIYTLATGYAAAAAARDGYDVGFGLSPDGVGISDRGYEVGDGAALGLAPGSWADLGFAPDRGVAGVEATLLWLTGDDPATATAECAAANATLPAIAPTEPAPAALATPSPTTAAPSIAADASTSQPVAAPSASPIVPADPPAVAAPAAATVDSPPAKNDDAGNRSDASGAADARGSQHTANRPRPSEDDSGRPNERSSARRDRRDQDRETAPEISASS
ncbi:MAG TPA: hypothetical protein VFU81_23795, partial [Thermomicrobiales bacterium]|nr:hypothetical protein [Thermomicrobiales bacterium]